MLTLKFFIIYILISSTIIYLSRYLGYFDKPNKRGIHKRPIINTILVEGVKFILSSTKPVKQTKKPIDMINSILKFSSFLKIVLKKNK